MSEVTRILDAVGQGDPKAAAQLLPLVYDELRRLAAEKMAREKPGQTLEPTALVHEAYLRLVTPSKSPPSQGGVTPSKSPPSQGGEREWDSRGHFFAAAAEAMRRILIENARRKLSGKHGGGLVHQTADPDDFPVANPRDPLEVMAVHETLDRLEQKAPRKAELVKLRYFLGCTMAEAAQILGVAPATAEEDWTYARAWLRRQWQRDEEAAK
jgi:RNA polymerase sigma factor (sigma-70 family)